MNDAMKTTIEGVLKDSGACFSRCDDRDAHAARFPRWVSEAGNLCGRVSAGVDSIRVSGFNRRGFSLWELEFAAPGGRLSVPAAVVIAAVKAATGE